MKDKKMAATEASDFSNDAKRIRDEKVSDTSHSEVKF